MLQVRNEGARRETSDQDSWTGHRHIRGMCRHNGGQTEDTPKPLPPNPDMDMSHFDIKYWDGLGAHRVLDAKERADRKKETCVSGVVKITYDKEALTSETKGEGESVSRQVTKPSAANTVWNGFVGLVTMTEADNTKDDKEDRPPSNIEIGGDALASETEGERESISRQVTKPSAAITVWNGFVGLVTMMEVDNSTDAVYADIQADGFGGNISVGGGMDTTVTLKDSGTPHAHKKPPTYRRWG